MIIGDKLFFSNFPPSNKSLISFIPDCLVASKYIYIEIINIDTIKGFISEEAFSIYERKVSYTIITTDKVSSRYGGYQLRKSSVEKLGPWKRKEPIFAVNKSTPPP